MNIDINADVENKLLKRRQVTFTAGFKGSTPSRKQVKEALCSKLGAHPDAVAIEKIGQPFGVQSLEGLAHVYASADGMKAEHEHILRRDRGEKGRPSKEATAAPAPAKPAAAKQEPAKEQAAPKPASAKAEEAKPVAAKPAPAKAEAKSEGAEQKKEHAKPEAASEKK